MDPKQVALIHAAMDAAIHALNVEYAKLMMRLGVKSIPNHRI